MLRSMNGLSFSGSDGFTWNVCMMAGHTPDSRIELNTSRPRPTPGSSQLRRTALANSSSAQITAMTMRISLAGIRAWLSVYWTPVKRPPSAITKPNRSSQYAQALSRTNSPTRIDRCVWAAPVSRSRRACRSMPPYR
jgi:hypothetical protein